MSVQQDLLYGSPTMEFVTDVLKSGGAGAASFSRILNGMRGKPLIRCENCTKSPEDLGPSFKFMLCGACKAKLDFAVHYCSKYVLSQLVHMIP